MREVRHWNRLPRGVIDAPSLDVLVARLDETGLEESVPVHGRDLELDGL